MKETEVRGRAFAKPLNDPTYPRGPVCNREFIVISRRTDRDVLRAVVPEPLEAIADAVNYEFLRMHSVLVSNTGIQIVEPRGHRAHRGAETPSRPVAVACVVVPLGLA